MAEVEFMNEVRQKILTQLTDTRHDVDYICDAAWIVSLVNTTIEEWCAENGYVQHRSGLTHIAPTRDGLAPKFRYRARVEKLPPPPSVYYVLDDMPEDAANVIPVGATITVEVVEVEAEDASHIRVILKYKGHDGEDT